MRCEILQNMNLNFDSLSYKYGTCYAFRSASRIGIHFSLFFSYIFLSFKLSTCFFLVEIIDKRYNIKILFVKEISLFPRFPKLFGRVCCFYIIRRKKLFRRSCFYIIRRKKLFGRSCFYIIRRKKLFGRSCFYIIRRKKSQKS